MGLGWISDNLPGEASVAGLWTATLGSSLQGRDAPRVGKECWETCSSDCDWKRSEGLVSLWSFPVPGRISHAIL